MHREALPLAFECPMDWRAMKGDDQRRYCGACNKHVVNLSACGNAAEARRTLEAAGPSPCIRYTSDASGRVLFRGPRTSLRALALVASVSAAAAGCEKQSAGGCAPWKVRKSTRQVTTMGLMVQIPPEPESRPPESAPPR
ncbi:MAG: hypothetical protein ACOYM9_17885 [Bradymonadia bacterium]